MDTRTTTTLYYPLNSVRVCIDEYQLPVMKGRAYTPLEEGEILFSDVNDLLLKLDAVFDRAGYPQAFQEKRSFSEKKDTHYSYQGIPKARKEAEELFACHGKVLTCDVQVDRRRNTSWQGRVRTSSEEEKVFQSEMELMNLLCAL